MSPQGSRAIDKISVLVFMTTGVAIRGDDVGGGTRHILALARAWGSLGASVNVVTTEAPLEALTEGSVLQLHVLGRVVDPPVHPRLGFLLSTFMPFFRYHREISEISGKLSQNCDGLVLVAGSPYLADVLSVLVSARKSGLAKVAFLHHMIPPPWWFPRRRGGFVRSILNWLQFQASLVLVKIGGMTPALYTPSELAKSGWSFHGSVLEDQGWLSNTSEPRRQPKNRQGLACFVGRVSPTKGVNDVISAWGLVSQKSQADLIIAGKPVSHEYERKVQVAIRRAGLSSTIKLLGVISEEEKEALLSSASIFLFPSYEEGWAISVMEAASRGAIPVVYDLPAYAYLGCEWTRVPVGDISGLASQVTKILESPKLQADLSRKLIERMEGFKGEEIAERQLTLFRRLLQVEER